MTADIRLLRWPQRDRDDYNRLVAAIDRVRAIAAKGRGEIMVAAPVGPEETDASERARVILAHRQARDAAAGDLAELFGEPGWDILLTLFIATEEQRAVTHADLVTAARLRATVLDRWIVVLIERGVLRRMDGAGTAATLSLTDAGMALARNCIGMS